jgi:DNA-binding LacI/PurR family transcriptional regulator
MTALSPRRDAASGPSRLVDVACEAGVSLKTASRVMNGSEAVSAAVRERVMAAAHALNYTPNITARRLSSGRTNVVAFVAAELRSGYAAWVVNSFVASADAAGYRTLLYNTQRDSDRDLKIVSSLVHGREVDGLVLFRSRSDGPTLEHAAAQVPIVLIDPHRCEPSTVPHVVVDNAGGARAAVEHLIGLGHRRIGHTTYENGYSLWMDHRLDGYRAAMYDSGLAVVDSWVAKAPTRDGCGQAALDMLRQPEPPTAIFAVSDWAAVSAINALEGTGVRVPSEISVVGFDDGLLAAGCRPPLTSIRQPMAQLATTALHELTRMIEGTPPAMRTVLPVDLIVRDSSGPPPTARTAAPDPSPGTLEPLPDQHAAQERRTIPSG